MAEDEGQDLVILTPEEAGVIHVGEVNIYEATAKATDGAVDADDWLRGLEVFPWDGPDDPEEFRAALLDRGDTVEGFKKTALYARWVGRKPWLADL